jgi:polyhydroxybutyrate depolymerase
MTSPGPEARIKAYSSFVLPTAMHALLLLGCCAGVTAGCQPRAITFEVDGGRYLELVPDGADHDETLPLLVYFHSYNTSAAIYAQRKWLAEGANKRGYLLILPDGIEKSWSHGGSPRKRRDEVAFMKAVLKDVESRWSISQNRVAGGFSVGGSMAWDIACYMGDKFSAFIPASGAFWLPIPAVCEQPTHLRHTHGTADQTVPMEGRAIGNSRQGDVLEGFQTWRSTNGCDEDGSEKIVGTSTCSVWSNCTSGKELQLCLHGGRHVVPAGYLSDSLDWAEGLLEP